MDEFTKALDTLKASGKFEYPLDVNAQNTGEWWPYAYSPMLQSFGGDLVDPHEFAKRLRKPSTAPRPQWGSGSRDYSYGHHSPVFWHSHRADTRTCQMP